MDDDWKENRRNKPQQKLYKPGSGPLRRTSYGLDNKMNSYDVTNGPRSENQTHFGSRNSIYEEEVATNNREYGGIRHKKPEQQLYVARPTDGKVEDDRHSITPMRCDNSHQSYNRRNSNNKNDKHGFTNTGNTGFSRGSHSRRDRTFVDSHNKNVGHNDVNYNRNYRQVSEPRNMSPTHHVQEVNAVDRNRDTRSMETSAGRHNHGSGGKPPSGRRNSAGYPSDTPRPKYTVNLDNLPPRLRKKFLEQAGHQSFDHNDHANREKSTHHIAQPHYNQGGYHNQPSSWSQTLPSRGRGRLRENEGFDRDKFINSYLKTCDAQSSRRSTPSSSYINLYEPNSIDNKHMSVTPQDNYHNHHKKDNCDASRNGVSNSTYNSKDEDHSKNESDSEPISCSSNLMDMTNLDWTEEVEKNMKFDDVCDSTASSPTRNMQSSSISQDTKSIETKSETREAKRRSKRRDKRSSSRGHKNDKRNERSRRDSGQHDSMPAPAPNNLKQRDRERRDSHRSNHSSNIGNSRDDLDRWRSLRSFSREQSTEGRIVSQCNSRDTSANRALSPRDNDGFRIPSAAAKNSTWTSTNQKKNGGGNWARNPSSERGRQSPAPGTGGDGAGGENASAGAGSGGGGGGRKSRRRTGRRRGRNSDTTAPPAPHPAGATPAPVGVNWRDEILESKKHSLQDRLDRHQEVNRNILNSTQSEKSESSTSHPGLLILPQSSAVHINKERGREGTADTQKLLYDYNNPSKPIVVQTHSSKVDTRLDRATTEPRSRPAGGGGGGGGGEAPDASEAQRAARHRPLLQEVDRADAILQTHTLRGPVALAAHWADVTETRKFLQGALQRLLMSDLKYCQADNVEHYFWKILYYNFIEVLRKSLSQASVEEKAQIVKLINTIIEEGNVYFENLVQTLEKTYKFNTGDYINDNHLLPPKGLGYVGLALISVQKLYVFLGDLARYKEQVNETNNYGKSKYFYTKAQQINPKNGRPYNQLAILAIYARRKLDAVFYYMRSLMSSNPFHSARESLISLFDENRKKYEAAERKRRAASESAASADDKTTRGPRGRGMRREVWVRPSGRRTTTLRQEAPPDALAAMTPVELNKNFITSYLHVHGKLVTKIGMETCRDSAALMLRQFRALLHQQPLPTPAARLLQLTQLNMFAVESTLSANKDVDAGSRSAWLECAVSISLLMFGALLERCCALLPEPPHTQQHADALLLLPAIKVWSDWMLCHSSVWNPPPSFDSFDIGSDINPWDWLAKLMNILETLDDKSIVFESEMKEGYEPVRLPEDGVLAGFTPLMYMEPAATYARAAPPAPPPPPPAPAPAPAPAPPHSAEHALRTRKLLFFGTEYLVGVEPPVLRLEYPPGAPPRYVSAVQRGPAPNLPLQDLSEDSEEEVEEEEPKEPAPSDMNWAADHLGGADGADETTRRLLRRKGQLETRRANMERRRLRMQELLRGGWVSVEVEVRPRWLVPDTNCFIDHLPLLRRVVTAPGQPYLLAVPIVVVTELEGLRRCARVGPSAAAALAWVGAGGAGAGAGAGAAAPPGVRFATSRGSLLASRVFTAERESVRATNDDKVLATALNLHANIANEPDMGASEAGEAGGDSAGCVRRVREVVLLTDDRNLRVKALAAELPARDLPSFVDWAALDEDAIATAADVNAKPDALH